MLWKFSTKVAVPLLVIFCSCTCANSIEIGAYYFPGWSTTSSYWRDIKGLPGSRSPGKSWPDREPLLGFYREEDPRVAEKHIEWASRYGITFFAYDWYWNGNSPDLNHAIDNFIRAKNKTKMKFTILWVASHNGGANTLQQFSSMVDYWIDHYFNDPQYLKIDDKPVVIVFSEQRLITNAAKFGMSMGDLFALAREKAKARGFKGIYVVGTSHATSSVVNSFFPKNGYDAVTGYNYLSTAFSGEYVWNKEPAATNFAELLEGYKSQWDWFMKNSSIPYFVPMSAGWDSSPWMSSNNCSSTPSSFKQMLLEGRRRIDDNKGRTKGIGIIYAWNEFGEGGYIEPTKKWRFKYLEAIKEVFAK